jgi:hypothetical protein
MYFVCLLEALTDEIDIQMPDEIAAAAWKPLVIDCIVDFCFIERIKALELY